MKENKKLSKEELNNVAGGAPDSLMYGAGNTYSNSEFDVGAGIDAGAGANPNRESLMDSVKGKLKDDDTLFEADNP